VYISLLVLFADVFLWDRLFMICIAKKCDDILWKGWTWFKEKAVKFWWRFYGIGKSSTSLSGWGYGGARSLVSGVR